MFGTEPGWFDKENCYFKINNCDIENRTLILGNNSSEIVLVSKYDSTRDLSFTISLRNRCGETFEISLVEIKKILGLISYDINPFLFFANRLKTLFQFNSQEYLSSGGIKYKRKGMFLNVRCEKPCARKIAHCELSIMLSEEILAKIQQISR